MDEAPTGVARGDGSGTLDERARVPREIRSATDEPGDHVEDRAKHLAARDPGRELVADLPDRQLGLPPVEAAAGEARVVLRGLLGIRARPGGDAFAPRVAHDVAAPARGAVELEHVVGHPEVFCRQPEDLLDLRDLVGTERVAVCVRGVGVLRRRPTDVAAQDEQARTVGLGHPGA